MSNPKNLPPPEVHFDSATGVYRWNSNNRIPPADCVTPYGIDTLPGFDLARTNQVRDEETSAFIDKYRAAMANHVYSDEEKWEMLAAFGPGKKIVNVFTGQEHTTYCKW